MSKSINKIAGFVIGAILIGIGIATGNVGLIIQGSAMIVTQAIVDLTAPKIPARQASEMSIALGEQPRVMLIGETFTPGSLVDGFDYGGKYGTDWEVLIIRLADHKCHSLTGFFVNDTFVPYTGDGNYSQYDGKNYEHLHLYFRADTTNDPLPAVVLDHGPGWTAADIGESGCDVIVAYRCDTPQSKNPIWPGGRPRFGFVVKGAYCYDPRKDDTVDGGSGPHRDDDPLTWEWSENAAICRYKWVRGVFANDDVSDLTKLLVGRGLTAEEAPPENIIAPANLCDEIAASVYPTALLDGGASLNGAAYSPNRTHLVIASGTTFQVWNLFTRSLVYSGTLSVNIGSSVIAVNDDLSFYTGGANAGDYVALVSLNGAVTQVSVDDMDEGMWKVAAGLYGRTAGVSSSIKKLDGDTVVSIAAGFYPGNYFDTIGGGSFGAGGLTSGGSYTTGIGFYDLFGLTAHSVATSTSGEAWAMDNGNGQFFAIQDDKIYLINQTTYAVDAGPVTAAGGTKRTMRPVHPGDTAIWIGWSRYSTLDLSLIETIDTTGFGGGTTSDPMFDPIDDAMLTKGTGEPGITMRFLHRHGGYRIAGPIYANQEFIDVEGMFAAATAGNVVTREGSVELEPGQAKSVVATFTDNDLLSGSQVSWNQGFLSQSNAEWVNTVVARYVEPDQKWNDHAAPVLRDNADIIADGKPREASLTLRLVRYQPQALRVAEINRRLGRLWGRATVKLGPRFCELEDGDWIQWQSDRYFGGGTKIFRIEAYSIDGKWQITLTLREINGSVYADDATFPSDKSAPATTPPPPAIGEPAGADWTLSATTLVSAGASVPALEITGAVPSDESAEAIVVEYWKSDGVTDPTDDPDSIPWTMQGQYAPDTAKIDITGLVGGATYYVAISYIVSGITGDRLVLGPTTIADLDVSAQVPDVDNDTTLASDSTTSVPSVHAVRGYVASAVTGLLDLKGSQDCSANPNYPSALKGDAYVVTVAGKIGGASGASVDVNDVFFATADNAGGTQASVGSSWDILEHNVSIYLTVDTVTGTSYTFASADALKHKRFTNGSAITATVPANASDAISVGTRIRITQAGAGQITLTPAGGVTLNSRDGALKSAGQMAVLEIEKVGTNEWDVLGDVST